MLSKVYCSIQELHPAELTTLLCIVIGGHVVTPASIVFLVVKLRINPPGKKVQRKGLSADETKKNIKFNEDADDKFLNSPSETEELENEQDVATAAHVPHWPGVSSFSSLSGACPNGILAGT